MSKKVAIVLFNLGGPDSLSSVKEFLFNLFYDSNIIKLKNPFRWLIAKIISIKRENESQKIYAQMGGRSTIFPSTQKQAEKLEKELNKLGDNNYKVFVSMRYWHPFAYEVIEEIEKFLPDEILLLPLYPQFSTTTTKSSLEEFNSLLKNSALKESIPKAVCCYYKDDNFIKSHVKLINEKISGIIGKYRILFSAHSLPKKIIQQGDPYQWQIEETCLQIVKELKIENLDYRICYQSKVGPLEWLSPSTEEEIIKASKEDIAVIIIPIAFVSEHSETLVELDIEYKKLFSKSSTNSYIRVAALNENENFIKALIRQIKLMIENDAQISKKQIKIYSEIKCSQDKFKECFCKYNK